MVEDTVEIKLDMVEMVYNKEYKHLFMIYFRLVIIGIFTGGYNGGGLGGTIAQASAQAAQFGRGLGWSGAAAKSGSLGLNLGGLGITGSLAGALSGSVNIQGLPFGLG